MNLRTKLVFLAFGLTLLGLGLGLAITYWMLVGLRYADLDHDNQLLAARIMEAVLTAQGAPLELEDYLVQGSTVSAAQFYRGRELVWEGGLVDAPDPLDPQGLINGAGTRRVGAWRVHTLSQGELSVQVGRSLTALQNTLRPYAGVALPLILTLSLLSGAAAWLIGGVALRPIETLTRAVRRFGTDTETPTAETLGSVLTVTGRDEAATLARAFAALLGRLGAEREREQRFLAYAAHELRTPISALRASLEAARARQAPLAPEGLARLHRQALRLETFAQNLLALSRAEAGEVRAQPLDLADVAGAAYDRFQPLALEGGYELVLTADAAPVRADPRLLEQALNNLVANALRHAAKGQVVIGSGQEGERRYLEVVDGGPGFSDAVPEGLGLRVVRSVARAHGGSLERSSNGGHHIRLYLSESTGAWEAPAAAPGNGSGGPRAGRDA